MKVLFAVSNEEISQAIIKKYQKEYKEIISHKNVYYFNAILKEIQKDKSYDRIVISEDLEAFSHTQYDQIDKFIFEKLDSISDEASNMRGGDIPVILICSDRRTKSDQMLVKLFGIGIYNAILGNDRSVDEVCRLIHRPRLKKQAKTYYKIDAEEVTYQAENENDVSEMEIQNILAHYKSLGKDEGRYIDSFNNIAAQYNDTQLRIISKFLPLNVRAVLEERSPKYQKIMSFNSKVSNDLRKTKNEKLGTSEKLLKPKEKTITMTNPVVIPSAVNMTAARKLLRKKQEYIPQPVVEVEQVSNKNPISESPKDDVLTSIVNSSDTIIQPVKRGRGRPRKNPIVTEQLDGVPKVKRGRGRPRKNPLPEEINVTENKNEQEIKSINYNDNSLKTNANNMETISSLRSDNVNQSNMVLPGFDDVNKEEIILPGLNDENEEEVVLPGFNDENEEEVVLPGFNDENEEEVVLPGFDNLEDDKNNQYGQISKNTYSQNLVRKNNNYEQTIDISSLLTADKKIVTFVGTSKNGTSFIVNNVAELLSNMGINVAILDATSNRNSYYIYTKNEEALRNIAANSIEQLSHGVVNGIQVKKNLTVFTSLPDEEDSISNVDQILETLVKNYSLILIDCDFNTPIGYFKQSLETYLIQSLDILTIQPLTAFLRELKSKNILEEGKLKIILNKFIKIKGVNEKTIIGGMAFYNDPAMSFMTELFDRNLIKYIVVPFEEEIYSKYLEGIINCEITLKGYSKGFMQVLKNLGNMVYPLVSGQGTYRPPVVGNNKQTGAFSPSMNDTLNQMKKKF